eukprot:CAMPEP_0170390034 /NCGR_PEP_ID=MMETSP0117_2-20130122/18929_1 /TAXON_ID=400756 /ORGANISM="Durinskia baltica, Strain CSIRO CS-38" /LENGTH=217 /DNA_ID=CAMNT_0010646049 /DNA_START=52 /DNA_END=705 /DNA_ORIENTATION=-
MSKIANVMISMLEEQAALIHRHINSLKQLADASADDVAHADGAPKKKVKAPVDPNKPKRPLSGYQIFMAENNHKMKEAHPDASATAIMSMVAAAWAQVPEEKKKIFQRQAEKLKESYLEDMAEYHLSIGEPIAAEKVAKKAKAIGSSSSSSSSAAPTAAAKKAPAVTIPVPAPAVENTPKKSEDGEKHKKHKRSESVGSESRGDTEKKHKKHKKDKK